MPTIDLTMGLNISDAAQKLKELREAAKMAVSGVAGDINATEALFDAFADRIFKAKENIKNAQSEISTNREWIQKLRKQAAEAQEALSDAPTNAAKKIAQKEIDAINLALNEEMGLLEFNKQKLKDYNEQLAQSQKALKMAQTELKGLQQTQKEQAAAAQRQANAQKEQVQVQKEQAAAYTSIRSQMTAVRNEMVQLELAGQKNSARYKELQNELGRLGTAYRKVQFEQKALSTGATQWAGIQSTLQGVMGGFAAYQGVLGLVATNSEELVKIQTRLQSVMGIIMGMTQVSNTLHATSAARMTTLAKVTELWTAANKRVATTLIRVGVAANTARIAAIAFNGALTMGIGAAIGIAISAITKLVEKHKEAKKAAEESAKKQREAFENYASSVGSNAGSIIAKFEALKQKYAALGDSLSTKKKFIKENADAFKELGVKIGNVNDADNLFINNADAFVASVDARARAAATMKVASEKYEEAFKKMLEAENIVPINTEMGNLGKSKIQYNKKSKQWSYDGLSEDENEELTKVAEKARKARRRELDPYKDAAFIDQWSEAAGRIAGEKYLASLKEAKEKAQKKLEAEAAQAAGLSYKFNEKASETLKNAGIVTADEQAAAEKARQEAEKRAKTEADAQKKLAEIIEAADRNLIQSRINAMNEGKEKELAQLDQNTNEKIAAILKTRQKELDAYNAAQKAAGEKPVENLSDDREKVYAEQIKNVSDESATKRLSIEEKYTKEVKKLYKSVVDAQLSEEERRINGIREQYDKLRESISKKVESGDITQEQGSNLIGMLDASQQKEELNVMLEGIKSYQQQRLDIIKAYNKKEAQLKDENGQFKDGVTQENIDELNRQREEALAAVDEAFASREESYNAWVESLTKIALSQLESAVEKAKAELKKLEESGQGGSQEAAVARATIYKGEKQIAKAKAQTETKTTDVDKTVKKYQRLQKTLNDVGKEFQEIGEEIGGTAGEAIALAGTIATSAASVIDGIATLTKATAEGIEGTVDTASKAIQAMETASIILAIISAALKLAMALYNAFSGPSKETKQYEALKEQYEGLIDVWDDLIERKKEYIDTSWGKELKNVGEETLALIQQKADAQRELAKARTSAGASAGSHTYGYRMWQGSYKANGQNWQDVVGDINKELDVNIRGMGDFANLTAEQLEWVREHYDALWAVMDTDYRNALENIIKYGDEAKETVKAINEQWTQLSFDDLYDDFVDTLLDMESSAEDFADNFNKYMQRAIISMYVGQALQPQLEAWYEKFANFSKSDEELTEKEVEELQKDLQQITEDGLKKREQLMSAYGWDSDSANAQEATVRGFQAMSQETGDELNGRFTDIQGKVTNIRDYVLLITNNGTQQLNETINIRDIMIQLNGNVADIRGYTQVLPAMNDTLTSMNRKLDDL